MIIELLTPFMLATAPVRIEVPESTYSHATQLSEYGELTTAQRRTYNGTQTFSPTGRPQDADSD